MYFIVFLSLTVCCCNSQYVYEYIIETESPLSELKTLPNCKETWAFRKANTVRQCIGMIILAAGRIGVGKNLN